MDANILLLDVFDDRGTPAKVCSRRLHRAPAPSGTNGGRQEHPVVALKPAE